MFSNKLNRNVYSIDYHKPEKLYKRVYVRFKMNTT